MARVLIGLGLVAAVAMAFTGLPPRQATCGEPTVMRACSLLNNVYQSACESGDRCDMPQNVDPSEVPVFLNGSLCRSQCFNDADCSARFGVGASCVRDGLAEGFFWSGSFCALRVQNPGNAPAECYQYATQERASFAFDGGLNAPFFPEDDDDEDPAKEPALFTFPACYNLSSTTCLCGFACTLPEGDDQGCVPRDGLMQFAYQVGVTSLNDVGPGIDFNQSSCPPDQFAYFEEDDEEQGAPLCSLSCGEGNCTSPHTVDQCELQFLVGGISWAFDPADALSLPGYVKHSCNNCVQDSDCAQYPLATAFCSLPDPAFEPFLPPPPVPPALGFANGTCTYHCLNAQARAIVEAPVCVAARFAFACTDNSQCSSGLACVNRVCTRGCASTAECEAAIGVSPFDAIVCSTVTGACEMQSDCAQSRYSPTAQVMPPYNFYTRVQDRYCVFACSDTPAGGGGGDDDLPSWAVVLMVFGIFFGILLLSYVAYAFYNTASSRPAPPMPSQSAAFAIRAPRYYRF